VITASDSNGTVVDEAGFTKEKLARLIDIKERSHGRVADYAREFGLTYLEDNSRGPYRWISRCRVPRKMSWTSTLPVS
jgi:glutamate dehydrogenase/leucine dehydrogenase